METTEPKFPHVEVQLVGKNGNAHAIMSRVSRAMRRGGCSETDVDEYIRASMSGDYDNLLLTAMKTVTVDP